jgi:hypothetical protein
LASNPHGSELPSSKRYSEGISSTTKGRGAGTQGIYQTLCIHLGVNGW